MAVGFVDPDQVERFREALNNDPEFTMLSKTMSHNVLLEVGKDKCLVKVREGTVTEMSLAWPPTYVWHPTYHVNIKAPTQDWEELLQAKPRPFYGTIGTGEIHHNFETGGDQVVRIAYHQALSRMIEVFREIQSGVTPTFTPRPLPPTGTIEPITGRYVHLDVDGVRYRVYFEESGEGIPMICQHTAGAENRQWRHILTDPEITSKYRVIAVDLPYHGKSLPPETIEWWKQEYRLTKALALDLPVALSHALGLERPVYMGSSVGAAIATDLAWAHPDEFRAFIAVAVNEYSGGDGDPVEIHDWYRDPRTAEVKSDTRGGEPPYSPEQYLREGSWLCAQQVSGVLEGDFDYYGRQHDLRDKCHLIDTSRAPLYLMNGDWDAISPPIVAEMLGAKIKGAKVINMNDVGHFPMCCNPDILKSYLMPVLNEITAKG